MAKANRDAALAAGNLRLEEWAIGEDVDSLAGAIGRDRDADMSIADRLGRIASTEAATTLQRLESSADKLVRKEAKRSLYRLEQKGITVAPAPSEAPVRREIEPSIGGYVSAVDGNGDQLVWLTRSQGGVLFHAFAVINDPDGLKEVDLAETTRRGLRAMRSDLEQRHGVGLVEVDWQYADFLIDRAFRTAKEQGRSGGDYPGIRARFTREPVVDGTSYVRDRIGAASVTADPEHLVQSETLLQQPELRSLLFRMEDVESYIEDWIGIVDSPLVLSDDQKRERIDELGERAVADLFGGEAKAMWVRRVESLALVFHESKRFAQAKQALAAALALEGSERGGVGVPVLEALTRTCLAFYSHMALQRRKDAETESTDVGDG